MTMATPAEYVQHHLEHLTLNLQTFTVGKGQTGFWVLNLDTLFVSVTLGILMMFFLRRAASNMREVPSAWQNMVEILVGFVDKTIREIYHGPSKLLAPLSFVIFLWVFLM